MIEVSELSRTFQPRTGSPIRALDRVSFSVAAGKVTGLIGPNGAGKTTLFRVLSGLLRPGSGSAKVAGFDVATSPLDARARLGLLTEEPGLPDRLTPLWHVALHASLHGLARPVAVSLARALLEELGLGSSMTHPHARLSKGTRMKVAVARALVHAPRVLLLDEPTAGLDIETAGWMRSTVRHRAREGCAVLLATHHPTEAVQLCDEVVILGRGRVLAQGPVETIRREAGGQPRLVLRTTAPAIESIRRLPGAAAVVACEDRLAIPGVPAADAPRLLELIVAAIAPVQVLEFGYESGPLEDAYHRIQREAP